MATTVAPLSTPNPDVKVFSFDVEVKPVRDFWTSLNSLSHIFFCWPIGLLRIGRRKTLSFKDLWPIRSHDRPDVQREKFEQIWEKKAGHHAERSPSKRTLLKTIFSRLRLEISTIIVGTVFISTLGFVGPLSIRYLVSYLEQDDPDMREGLIWVAVFTIILLVQAIIKSHLKWYTHVTVIRLTNSLNGMIFEKVLRLPNSSKFVTQQGKLVNLVQSDLTEIQTFVEVLSKFIKMVTKLIVGFYLLYAFLGMSFVAGLSVVVIISFTTFRTGLILRHIQLRISAIRDQRIRKTSELFGAIKFIKLFAWEEKFVNMVVQARLSELKQRNRLIRWKIVCDSLLSATPNLVALATFAFYTSVQDETLSTATVFGAIAIFNTLRGPIHTLPAAVQTLIQNLVALERIQEFLLEGEAQVDTIEHVEKPFGEERLALEVKGGSFEWTRQLPELVNESKNQQIRDTEEQTSLCDTEFEEKDSRHFSIENLNLKIPCGQFVAIVGDAGSGKSSILSAILGGMEAQVRQQENPESSKSTIKILNSVSLASQNPWLQSCSIRENILFGEEFDELRYAAVLSATSLAADLKILEHGDQTIIGEKGLTLSGGQKARVSLARALYSDKDLLILDDILSALDGFTATSIFEHSLLEYSRNKTRVFVTHAAKFLKRVDRVLIVENGVITRDGHIDELMQEEGSYAQQLMLLQNSIQRDCESPEQEEEEVESQDDERSRTVAGTTISIMSTASSEGTYDGSRSGPGSVEKKAIEREKSVLKDEENQGGSIRWETYKKYIRYAGGMCLFVTIILLLVLVQVSRVTSDFWLAHWANQSETEQNSRVNYYLTIFTLLTVTFVFWTIIKDILVNYALLRAGRRIHERMLSTLVKAPVNTFFHRTLTAQITNRFSGDLTTIDSLLEIPIKSFFNRLSQIVATFIVIGIVVPYFLIAVPIIAYFLASLSKFNLQTSNQAARLVGISRGPVLNVVTETVRGLTMIRCSQKQHTVRRSLNSTLINLTRAMLVNAAVNSWFALQLKYIAIAVWFSLSFWFVLTRSSSAEAAALVLTYVFLFQESVGPFMNSIVHLTDKMISVERADEYTHIDSEGDFVTDNCIEDEPSWPTKGEIVFDNYSVAYRPYTPLVLKNLSFSISGGEKIGIVGRTGAGKSTITLALFRILQPSQGSILIDGVDISKIGLTTLRSRMTMIPQEPILFANTLRFNLDPFNHHSDEQILQGLKKVGLSEKVDSLKDGLDHELVEEGGNFSVGERQMVCIARALIETKKIVIIDEATASIDSENDQVIQGCMHEFFENSTVLTIAHRLNTLEKSDRIMVLSEGALTEFDTAKNLASDETSIYHSLLRTFAASPTKGQNREG